WGLEAMGKTTTDRMPLSPLGTGWPATAFSSAGAGRVRGSRVERGSSVQRKPSQPQRGERFDPAYAGSVRLMGTPSTQPTGGHQNRALAHGYSIPTPSGLEHGGAGIPRVRGAVE